MKDWKTLFATVGEMLFRLMPDIMVAAGAGCIVYGAALVYPPAGWIVGGVLAIAASVVISKGSDDG